MNICNDNSDIDLSIDDASCIRPVVVGNSDFDTANDVALHRSYQHNDNSDIGLSIDVASCKTPVVDGNSDFDTSNDVDLNQSIYMMIILRLILIQMMNPQLKVMGIMLI